MHFFHLVISRSKSALLGAFSLLNLYKKSQTRSSSYIIDIKKDLTPSLVMRIKHKPRDPP